MRSRMPRARSAISSVDQRRGGERLATGPPPAVGARHSTWAPRPPGAASRLTGLQTPPSTYSRPAISTGANSHGTAHEASTASRTRACGAPGAPNSTRRAAARDRPPRPQAAVELGAERVEEPASAVKRRCGRGAVTDSAAERASRPAGASPANAIGASGLAATVPKRNAARAVAASPRGATARVRRRAPFPRRAIAGIEPPSGDQRGGHDRARRGPEHVLAVAEVEAGRRLDGRHHAAHPGFASVPPAPRTSVSGSSRIGSVTGVMMTRHARGATHQADHEIAPIRRGGVGYRLVRRELGIRRSGSTRSPPTPAST